VEEVRCDFKYSGAARAFLACAAAGTLALLALAPFPWEARAAAGAWVVALAFHSHRALFRARGLRLDCKRAIAVLARGGEWRSGTVRDGSFVAPWLAIVRWRPEGARLDRTLVILPDMASAEAMRRIRVILKWA
jgi:toxin CptA